MYSFLGKATGNKACPFRTLVTWWYFLVFILIEGQMPSNFGPGSQVPLAVHPSSFTYPHWTCFLI